MNDIKVPKCGCGKTMTYGLEWCSNRDCKYRKYSLERKKMNLNERIEKLPLEELKSIIRNYKTYFGIYPPFMTELTHI